MKQYSAAAVKRTMKVQEVILRAMSKQLTWMQAAEILGVTDRAIRRMRREWEGRFDGLFDRQTQMRLAIYARVSTKKHGQDTDTQLLPLRQYAAGQGLEVVQEYVDNGFSGSKDRRPQLDRLMKDAHRRTFDAVLVFKLDRFGRSTSHLIRSLETFQSLGIGLISLTECLDSTTAQGKLMFTMLSGFAEFERSMIVERINYGLDRARKQGKKLGRREVIVSKDRIAAYRQEGRSYRWIADTLGVSVGKVHSIAN